MCVCVFGWSDYGFGDRYLRCGSRCFVASVAFFFKCSEALWEVLAVKCRLGDSFGVAREICFFWRVSVLSVFRLGNKQFCCG